MIRGGLSAVQSRGGLGAVDSATAAGASAQYWVAAADGSLSDEKDVSALVTNGALIKNAAGVPAAAVANTDYLTPLSIADVWRAEAAADLDLLPSEMVFLISGDTAAATWVGSNGAGGARTAVTGSSGARLSTGGGAGGFALFTSASGPPTASFEHLLAGSSKWWLKARFACNYAGSGGGPAGAASVMGIGAVASGQALAAGTPHELMIGVDGAGANFVMTGGAGVTIDSGVPVDAVVRDHKGWRDGSTSYYQINSGAAVSGSARPSAASRAVVLAYDSAAVLQVVDVFLAAVAFPVRALGA